MSTRRKRGGFLNALASPSRVRAGHVAAQLVRLAPVVTHEALAALVHNDHDVRHKARGVRGHELGGLLLLLAPSAGLHGPEAGVLGVGPARALKQLPRQEHAVVAQRIEALVVQRSLVEEEAVGQPTGLHCAVVSVGRRPVGCDETPDWHARRVGVRAETTTDLRVHGDAPVGLRVEAESVELAAAVADHDPVEDAAGPDGRRKAQARDDGALLDVGIHLRDIVDEGHRELAARSFPDLVELQQSAPAQHQDPIGVGGREEVDLDAGLPQSRQQVVVDAHGLDVLDEVAARVHGDHRDGEPVAADLGAENDQNRALLLGDACWQILGGEEAHLVDVLAAGEAEAAESLHRGLLRVAGVGTEPLPDDDLVLHVARREDLFLPTVLAHASDVALPPSLGRRQGAAGLVHVELAEVVDAPAVDRGVVGLGGPLPEEGLRVQPRAEDGPPVVVDHRLRGVLLPELQHVVVHVAPVRVDAGLQVGSVLRLLVRVQCDEELRGADALAPERELLAGQRVGEAVLVHGQVHVRRGRVGLDAVELEARRGQPPVQPNEDVHGLLELLDEAHAALLLDVVGPPVHEADDVAHGAHLLARKLHADLQDHLVGRRCPDVTQVLHDPQLAGLEEEALDADGPLRLVDLEGEHDRVHEVAVRVAAEVRGQELGEALTQVLQEAPVRVAVVHDVHQLHGAALDHLVEHVLCVELARPPDLVRVKTPDVVHRAVLQGGQQLVQVPQVVRADGVKPLPPGRVVELGVGHALHQLLRAVCKQRLDLGHQGVVVLVDPALRRVGHLARVMPDLEAVMEAEARHVALGLQLQRHDRAVAPWVLDELPVDMLAELLVLVLADLHEVLHGAEAVLVQHLHDAPDAVDDGRGVRELKPADVQALLRVGPLLSLQDLLAEELLESLVGQVDAELLEAVHGEAFEAVDVERADAVVAQLAGDAVLLAVRAVTRRDAPSA
mmetsp:Transcript_7323/g.19666  ORF Transcript_7323/g.19666 Transcript_7323/m.19666 type:complete len:955 (-) Transcript_7323:1494-4358(-)